MMANDRPDAEDGNVATRHHVRLEDVRPADKETLAELERFGRDVNYYYAHHQELLEQYPEQYVGIFNESVAGANPNLKILVAKLREGGTPPERTFVKYLTHKPITLIL